LQGRQRRNLAKRMIERDHEQVSTSL
jgi:hypothetical protein